MAPELPALTTASASPRFIISKATRMDESFLRSAMLGDSCIGTTWDAGAMAICGAPGCLASSAAIMSGGPTRTISTPSS